MRRQRLLLLLSAIASVTLWTSACGDGATEPPTPPPDPPRPATVTVTPATVELAALAATAQLSAEVRDQNGQVMAGATVTWASGAATVATVSASGLVTAVANGSATITATSGSASGSATVTVAQEVSAVTVTPAEASFAALGDTMRLAAEAFDANGQTVAGAGFSWATSEATIATVDATGLVTAMASGSATITATSGSASGSATVTVAQQVSAVTVTPAEASFAALGDTVRLSAEALDANGQTVAGAGFSWATSEATVATVDESGLVTAVANGSATITATSGSASGSATVTVAQEVSAVTVTPAEASFAALGDTVRLAAEAFDANGRAVAGAEFSWTSSAAPVATVSESGLVTAVANGSATITATSGSASGSATVTVAQEVSAVTVTPAEASFAALGDTVRLAAEAFDANGRAVGGAEFTWESSDSTIATVDATGLVTAMASGSATITATSGSVSGSATVTVAQEVSAVTVTPAEASFAALGDTMRLAAEAFDANGQTVAGAGFSWATSEATIATVDATGLVTAMASGSATITATSGSASGSATVTVAQEVSAVTVTPAEASFAALGDTVRLAAEAFDANGRAVAGAEFSWTSSAAPVATVSESGLVTAVANGSATITATSGSASGSATVTVAQEVSAVTVKPATASLVALGDTVRLSAEAFDANGRAVGGAEFTWESSDSAVATVDASGRVTAMASGSATITATSGSASGSATVSVAQEVSAVTVTPAEASFAALGDTVRLSAEALDANGQTVAGAGFSWATSEATVATVDASGLVTAVASGSATITAMSGSVSGSATVTVAQEVSAVTVVPDTATVVEGDTLRLAATVTDANGQVVTGAEFVWGSGDTTVAVVDASGLVTGVGAGQVQVTATAAGVTGRAELTVVAPVPTAVAVTPDTVVLTSLGQTAQLTAAVRDQAGRAMDGVPVAWSSADTTVAVVDSAGLVGAVGGGAATITATAGEASGDALVTVVQSVDSLTVSPPMDTIAPGDTIRLVAEAYDETGHVVEGAVFTWSSSDAPVATVDPSGLVRGAGEGTATITATAGDVSGTSEITVVNPDRAALMALYNATDGPNWVDNTNWLTDAPLGEWYGVDTDAIGRVVRVDLSGWWDGEREEWRRHGLTGTVPPELGGLSNLRYLHLGYNALTGPIPGELGGLANLEYLNLWVNDLTGLIPSELGHLANLKSLELGANDLTGPIPDELGDLANLVSLTLSGNALTGPIPPELGDLPNLWTLNLYSNDLSGAIPPELGDLSNLQYLYLHRNELTGSIPPEFGGLANLQSLILGWNHLSGAIPPELGRLVNLRGLHLRDLDLSGTIPPELGDLENLDFLGIGNNDLSGPIPPELGGLENLERLGLGGNELGAFPHTFLNLRNLRYANYECDPTGICVPGTSEFVAWTKGLLDADRLAFCNASDQAVLTSLHELMAAGEWAESGGWLGGPALEEWHGVETDSLGWVTALVLSDNGLSGSLPGAIADLGQLTSLRIDGNALGGRLPLSLTVLDLDEFHYDGTDLCEPADAGFRDWLDGIPSHQGTGVQCGPLTERDVLVALYGTTGGPGWTNRNGWLTEAPLRRWSGVEVDAQGRVVGLDLGYNGLSGAIPPELGGLSNLEGLNLAWNDLSGPIPPELGGLSNLKRLNLYRNELSGAILRSWAACRIWRSWTSAGMPFRARSLQSWAACRICGSCGSMRTT